jgi:hypothetical protein
MILVKTEKTQWDGITEEYWMHPDMKTITIRRVQDADPIFAENKRRLNSVGAKSRRDYGEGLGVKVASIPMGLVEEVKMKTGLDLMTCPDAELRAFINNPDYAKIRTAHGMV